MTRTRKSLDTERSYACAIAVALLVKAKRIRICHEARAKRLLTRFCVARVELCASTAFSHRNCEGVRQSTLSSRNDVVAVIDPNRVNEPLVCRSTPLRRLSARVSRVLRIVELAVGRLAFEVRRCAWKTRKASKGPPCAAIPWSTRRNIYFMRAVARSHI